MSSAPMDGNSSEERGHARLPPLASMSLAHGSRVRAHASLRPLPSSKRRPHQLVSHPILVPNRTSIQLQADASEIESLENGVSRQSSEDRRSSDAAAQPSHLFGNVAVVVARLASAVVRTAATAISSSTAGELALPERALRVFPWVVPRRSGSGQDPAPAGAGGRGPAIVWLRNDVRLHDHEPFVRAHEEASHVLPVYCFDPREYGKCSTGHYKNQPHRARLLLDSIADLRRRLREAGSDLVVRLGRPESVLLDLVRRTGAGSVYCHVEVPLHDMQVQARLDAALSAEGADLKAYRSNSLFAREDLPFGIHDLPRDMGSFMRKVAQTAVRQALPAPSTLKGLPEGRVDAGRLPSMRQLGFRGEALRPSLHPGTAEVKGGESEALKQLSHCLKELLSTRPREKAVAEWMCRQISPYLATGCMSRRLLYHELQKAVPGRSLRLMDKRSSEPKSRAHSACVWVTTTLMTQECMRLMLQQQCEPFALPSVPEAADTAGALLPAATGLQAALA